MKSVPTEWEISQAESCPGPEPIANREPLKQKPYEYLNGGWGLFLMTDTQIPHVFIYKIKSDDLRLA